MQSSPTDEDPSRRSKRSETEFSYKQSAHIASANKARMDVMSETDDEEERMDCVHDIHQPMDGMEADSEYEENDYYNGQDDTFQTP
jgi:hypothetical protein